MADGADSTQRNARDSTTLPAASPGVAGAPEAALAGLSPESLAMARRSLEAEGCQAVCCESADGLFARVRQNACALVLADPAALGMSAGELTRCVKALAPQARVLIVSSNGSVAAPVEALRAGACDYLPEPVPPDEWRARLRAALSSRRLELRLRQRALSLAFVTELSETLAASLDLRQVLGAAVAGLRALVDFELAAAILRRQGGHEPPEAAPAAEVLALTPGAEVLWPKPAHVAAAGSTLAWDFQGSRPATLGTLAGQSLPGELAVLEKHGFASLLLLPLVARGLTIGALALASRHPEAFAEADLDLLQHVGGHLASAILNAQLHGSLRQLSASLEQAVEERTREAREAKQYLESLLETAGDAVITVDPHGSITSWNAAARRILGYARDEVAGRDICDLASGQGARDQLASLVRRTLEGEVASNVETAWARKDRKEVSVSLTVSPIIGAGAAPTGVLVIARDVTERRRLQEELFHSEKLASIGQLAAGVAHQVNNPLGAISGRAQMLLRLSGPPEEDFLREQLAKIQADCARIAETVNDLLGFARKTETVKQYTSVNLVLDETVEMICHGRAAQQIRIERRYAPNLPPIMASANHLRQLFANLMTNAFDAMPEGGTLTIATLLRPSRPNPLPPGEGRAALSSPSPSPLPQGRGIPAAEEQRQEATIEVSFADTGVGIPPEDMPRIFEPFFTTKAEGQGTGLGLAVARRIVDLHNGRLDVQSTPGLGTTFTILFPIG
mgnify:FL=1